MRNNYLLILILILIIGHSCKSQESNNYSDNSIEKAANEVLERTFGKKVKESLLNKYRL